MALFNRSPGRDSITIDFDLLKGVAAGQTFDIYDIWNDKTLNGVAKEYTTTVGAHDTALLVLEPAAGAPAHE